MAAENTRSQRQYQRALAVLRRRPLNRRLHEDAYNLLRDSSVNADSTGHSVLSPLLEILFDHDFVRHADLAHLAIAELKSRYPLFTAGNREASESLATSIGQDRLFLRVLTTTVNVDRDVEVQVRELRRFLLFNSPPCGAVNSAWVPLIAAIAEQSFNNEYILNEDEDEGRAVAVLDKWLRDGCGEHGAEEYAIAVMLLAMYRPVVRHFTDAWSAQVLARSLSGVLGSTLTRLVREPLEEARLAPTIPGSAALVSDASLVVRNQYEENPYPRWFALRPTRASPQPSWLHAAASWPFGLSPSRAQILVPGCGTGQHPLQIAAGAPRSHIVAADLSRASLAYGQRMAQKLGIRNVEFLQYDLLRLPDLGRQFHHIDCVGVLHHLEDPIAGWHALDQVLLPGGTLRLGLYSRVARLHIESLRGEVRRRQLPPTPSAMKAFRGELLTAPRFSSLVQRLTSVDFFCLSGFRDLLFHGCEHQFSITELAEPINRFNYRFLGCRLRGPLRTRYLELFPDDAGLENFENWCSFERHYAGTGALLTFTLQKM